jgi:hypothetical protein
MSIRETLRDRYGYKIGEIVIDDLSDPLISNDRKESTERAAPRYGLGEAGHERG